MNRVVVIASIYPLPLQEERPGYIPTSVFKMPAAAPGEVQYLRVVDSEIKEYVGHDRHINTADKTTAEKVAADLVRCWTHGFPGIPDANVARPGIMAISGDEITQEELDLLTRVQTEFARLTIIDADVSHGKGRPDLITKRHHALAKWLKVTNRPWQEKMDRAATKNCPYCGEQNNSAASKCKNCREIIDRVRYDAVTAAIKAGRAEDVEAALQRVANVEDATVESLSSGDVDELLRQEGITVGASAGGKKR